MIMGFSVNTNTGAMAALQSLTATNKGLDTTQSRINTGLAVASTKDDSASYTIAQTLRGEMGGLKAVTSSLSRAKSTVDVAVAGAEQISDVLNQMKAKAIEASDTGLDAESLSQINEDFKALHTQIGSIIEASEFNGTNLLKDNTDASGSVSALKGTDVNAADDANVLTVNNQNLSTMLTGISEDGFADADEAKAMVTTLEGAETTMKTTLTELGSGARAIDNQLGFVSKLSDVIEGGIGNLVDADLAKESAKLQALQVKQQLGLQALSIANQAPQSIMSLFR
jgi:flagellin